MYVPSLIKSPRIFHTFSSTLCMGKKEKTEVRNEIGKGVKRILHKYGHICQAGGTVIFLIKHTCPEVVSNASNQLAILNSRKSQRMGCFLPKNLFWYQNQKFASKNFQPWNSKPFKVHEHSNFEDPKDTPHTQGGSNRAMNTSPEACCMIEGWDQKHLWKSVCIQAASEAQFERGARQTLPELVD